MSKVQTFQKNSTTTIPPKEDWASAQKSPHISSPDRGKYEPRIARCPPTFVFYHFFGLCSCSLKPEFLLPWDGRLWELSRNLTEKGGYSPTLLYFRGRSFKTRWFRTPFPTRQDQFSQKESVDSISEVQTFQKTQPPQFPKGGLGIRPEIPPYFLARPREI